MELSLAQNIANNVVRIVRNSSVRAEVAGSIRRKKANVKDVEIVAIVRNYSKLYADLSTLGRFIKPGVSSVIDWPPKHGAKYVRMLLNEGIKLDLFIANSDNWGALLCMRTGSASDANGSVFGGFVPAMFKRWKKVSCGGMMKGCQPTLPDGTMLVVKEEREFFELCGVDWIEPELRTDSKALRVKR